MDKIIGDIECNQFLSNNENYLMCENVELGLVNGVYFCRLTYGNNEVWEKIMIINN